MCAAAGTCVSSGFPVNSSNHSGISRNWFPAAPLRQFPGAPSLLHEFAGFNELHNPAAAMSRMSLCQNLTRVPGRHGEQNSPSCKKKFFPSLVRCGCLPLTHSQVTQSTQRHASILEKKGPSLGKINVKVPHQRSPYAMKCEDRSHGETERQQRCARSKACSLAKIFTSSKKNTRLHSTFPRRNGYSRLSRQKEPEEREFVVDSGASVHMVSKNDLHFAEHEEIEEFEDGDDGQRRGAKQRRSDGICQRIGLVCDGYAS